MKRCISFLIPRSVCEDPKYYASGRTEGISFPNTGFQILKLLFNINYFENLHSRAVLDLDP